VLCYEDVSTPQSFEPNYYVDVDGYLEDHLKAVAFHQSQAHRNYMNPEVVRGRAAHRGMQIGASYALAFRALNIVR
jgi:LmbE family N-acetylglucosaminyl deacetylase